MNEADDTVNLMLAWRGEVSYWLVALLKAMSLDIRTASKLVVRQQSD
jgi:hypothetical protein